MNYTLFRLPEVTPETITVARRMYLVPRDATIPGGMAYRHTGSLRPPDAEFVADDCGLPPHERAAGVDFYTYEKIKSPEPALTIQAGLVLGNVRYDNEGPDESRHIVMFLDEGRVAVAYRDGEARVSPYTHWGDFDPSQNDMVFDVIFDPEHETTVRVADQPERL